jgi:ketosteroid isomerase-like protein
MDLQAVADRVELTALQAEFTDAGMRRDFERLASLFTEDGTWRMPHIPASFTGRAAIRAAIGRLQGFWEFFVQNAHPGVVTVEGDAATGRVYIVEFGRMRNGESHLNYALYHDRYRRTPEGWKFTERLYEIRYMDTTPLAGSPPDGDPIEIG